MKKYLLANFRLHNFKSLGYKKASKYSQIHANSQAICAKK